EKYAGQRAYADDEHVADNVDACEQRGDLGLQALGGGLVAERLELRVFYGCRDATDQAAEIAGGLLNSLLERLLNLVSALQDQVVRATHGRLGSVRVRESTDRGGELLVVRPRE